MARRKDGICIHYQEAKCNTWATWSEHRTSVHCVQTTLKVSWMIQEEEEGQEDDGVTISKTGLARTLADCTTVARDRKSWCDVPWSPTFSSEVWKTTTSDDEVYTFVLGTSEPMCLICHQAVSVKGRLPCDWGVQTLWSVCGWQVKLCDPLVTHGPCLTSRCCPARQPVVWLSGLT